MVVVPDPGGRIVDEPEVSWAPWSEDVPRALANVHRSAFAAELAAGLRALDLSPGDGYGSALIAERAKSVVRVDPEGIVVLHGRCNYRAPNLTFVHSQRLEAFDHLRSATDVVVAFGWEGLGEAGALAEKVAAEMPAGALLLLSAGEEGERAAALVERLRRSFSHVLVWSQWAGGHLAREGGQPSPAARVGAVIACSNQRIEAPATSALDDYRFLLPRLAGRAPVIVGDVDADWDETRLRRQLAAFDVAAREGTAAACEARLDARAARLDAEQARSDLAISKGEAARLSVALAATEQALAESQRALGETGLALAAAEQALAESRQPPAAVPASPGTALAGPSGPPAGLRSLARRLAPRRLPG